jgi:hypothetical protein
MKGGTVAAPLYACIQVTVAHTQAISVASEASFVALMSAVNVCGSSDAVGCIGGSSDLSVVAILVFASFDSVFN